MAQTTIDPQSAQVPSHVSIDDVLKMEFFTPGEAREFYMSYSRLKVFAIRKSKRVKNAKGEIIIYTFVCNRQGLMHKKWLEKLDRKREQKPVTRCGCVVEMRIKRNHTNGKWFVSQFVDDHNHTLLSERLIGYLPSHRNTSDVEIAQMNSLRQVRISIPKIYQSFAMQVGGFNLVRFTKQDMHNEWEAMVDLHRKLSWVTAYIRGKFFIGIRTTSQCKSLHAKLGGFVESRYGILDFVTNFQRCVDFLRDKEEELDFRSFMFWLVLISVLCRRLWSSRGGCKSTKNNVTADRQVTDTGDVASQYHSKLGVFVDQCKSFAKVTCLRDEDYKVFSENIARDTIILEVKHGLRVGPDVNPHVNGEGVVG
ncbi:hypothetical protein Ahy_B10g102035 [Arachis hypogaea]|uniref:FAR1 domain-containing protein n=1 Tax=Arachis hypogaea TaxID=3818 RepID=A0A444X0Y9_ARAHY|nr:hypothetical protein Ahy_B10g102035 [Arachis hypogaea]